MRRKGFRNPTIADVARECGVGPMTVSRVVNGSNQVRPETAARVRAAIKHLGYQPNEAARILQGQSPRTIGLILPDLADPFFAACANGVQEAAAAKGYLTLLLASSRTGSNEARELNLMMSRNLAGLLIVPSDPACIETLKRLQAAHVPVVMIDRTFPGAEASEVMVENEIGSIRATNHLIDHGHRNILCVGYDRQFNSIAQRIRGYERAMTEAALKPQFAIVENSVAVAAAVLKRIRSPKPPTAIFALNNVSSTRALSIMQRENVAIPQDMAIIGFDDFDLAPLLSVSLTAVRQPAAELGRHATRIVLNSRRVGMSQGQSVSEHVVLPTELVIRRSCGCAPQRVTFSHSQL